ncbi:MAG: RagB/SusD family nutrient uptake outer membrane protein [Cyclobacteriaceae bacterium]
MKNNITLIIIFVATLFSCSDEFLEPDPISFISGDSFFTSEDELETAIINMYDGIQGVNSTSSNDNHAIQVEFQLTEMRSDNTRTKASEGEQAQFERFDIDATNGVVADYYRSFYNVIYRANVVLANIDVASEARKGAFEGEAKFVRAYAYYNLVRLFGDLPLVDRIITPAEEDISFTRVPTSQIYELIVADLEIAVANLDNSYKNRASKAAAETLLAKVHLTLKNYATAQTLLESVMASGFSLEPEFKDVFYNENNSEVIFAIGYIGDNAEESQNFSAEWLNAVGRTSGINYLTDEAKLILDEKGGNRTPYSYRIDTEQPTQHQVVKYLPDGDASLGIDPTAGDPTLAGNDWIVLRYADVLLMHTEAIMAGQPTTGNAAAIASFQAVRDRAGLTDPVANISLQDLLDERRVELAFENHRLFDLIRLGVAENVLGDFAEDNGYSFSVTDLLLPIPELEIGLSKGKMRQNDGY